MAKTAKHVPTLTELKVQVIERTEAWLLEHPEMDKHSDHLEGDGDAICNDVFWKITADLVGLDLAQLRAVFDANPDLYEYKFDIVCDSVWDSMETALRAFLGDIQRAWLDARYPDPELQLTVEDVTTIDGLVALTKRWVIDHDEAPEGCVGIHDFCDDGTAMEILMPMLSTEQKLALLADVLQNHHTLVLDLPSSTASVTDLCEAMIASSLARILRWDPEFLQLIDERLARCNAEGEAERNQPPTSAT